MHLARRTAAAASAASKSRDHDAAATAVIVLGLAVFTATMTIQARHRKGGPDREVLLRLRRPARPRKPIGPGWLRAASKASSIAGSLPVLCTLAALSGTAFWAHRRKQSAVLILLSTGGAILLRETLKRTVKRPRPPRALRLDEETNGSFPSGHALISLVLVLALASTTARDIGGVVKRLAMFTGAAATALAIGASRIYRGSHWMTDVIGGWGLGAAWAAGAWLGVGRPRSVGRNQPVTKLVAAGESFS